MAYFLFFSPQAGYRDAEALKRQDQLIAEESAMQRQDEAKHKAQSEKDKEKKAKKKVGGAQAVRVSVVRPCLGNYSCIPLILLTDSTLLVNPFFPLQPFCRRG